MEKKLRAITTRLNTLFSIEIEKKIFLQKLYTNLTTAGLSKNIAATSVAHGLQKSEESAQKKELPLIWHSSISITRKLQILVKNLDKHHYSSFWQKLIPFQLTKFASIESPPSSSGSSLSSHQQLRVKLIKVNFRTDATHSFLNRKHLFFD